MNRPPLLLEIGCEEIPARMIRAAVADLAARLLKLLEQARLDHSSATTWAGPRRLTVRVDEVQGRQADRDEWVSGPPASVAFDADGKSTPAAVGFAKKQGIAPEALERRSTDRGEYVGFQRQVVGRSVGEILAETLPAAVESMSFPKSMRWAEGRWRWVRPVHWLVALHGEDLLPVELFGIRAGGSSAGHRFLGAEPIRIEHPDRYPDALRSRHVIVDPTERRTRVRELLERRARELEGTIVDDPGLLDEVSDLVEWPGAVAGTFDEAFLELPRELLVTTLRHHQKCFSLEDGDGRLRPAFIAIANTDRDSGGHIRRGNEWVIGGRLHDARFFWGEDLGRPLSSLADRLEGVVFHAKLGSYADKARRMAGVARSLAERLDLESAPPEACATAAELAKVDLVTGTVGEFPELQGRAGGLLLAAEGRAEAIARGVYEHYQPVGPADDPPATDVGAVVSVADKLDTLAAMIGIGETPTGSRDPFGLRRAAGGVFRVVLAKGWPVSLRDLGELAGAGDDALAGFLADRLQKFLRDAGYTPNEIQAVFSPRVDAARALALPLEDIDARLRALTGVRSREDFAHLVDLTKRVDNILVKGASDFETARRHSAESETYEEPSDAARELDALVTGRDGTMTELERDRRYDDAVNVLAELVDPVDRFFEDVLVIDPDHPLATLHRRELLNRLHGVLTRCFDIRELAGQAERRTS